MNKGTVKFFQTRKGWGFITQEDGTDIFVHWTGVKVVDSEKKKTLQQGQNVEFDVIDTEKGKQAINVTVLEETSKEDFEKIVDTINRSAQKVLNGEE